MRTQLLLLLPLLTLLSLTAATSNVPRFDVNLDEPAFTRWRQVAKQYGPLVKRITDLAINDRVPAGARPLLRLVALRLGSYLPQPYHNETLGFAHFANVSVANMVALQLIYDATAFCTSIVAVDRSQRVWHARNLDYGLNSAERDLMRRLTIDVRFLRGGRPLIKAVTVAGYIGVLTGVRSNGFSVSLDERNKGSAVRNFVSGLMMILKTGRLNLVALEVRSVLETVPNYSTAVHKLAIAPLIAPCYFIVGGVSGNEGAVVTRGQERALDVFRLNASAGRWYILETNYDRWTTPPPNDNRRLAAHRAMDRMGRGNLTMDALFRVLFTPPVLNSGTVFSSVMSASHSLLNVTFP